MKCVKVQNEDGLVRDIESGAILNVNNNAYQKHLREREKQLAIINERNFVRDEINNLKQEMSEIKSLLRELVQNGNTK